MAPCCFLGEALAPRLAELDAALRAPNHRSYSALAHTFGGVTKKQVEHHKKACLGLGLPRDPLAKLREQVAATAAMERAAAAADKAANVALLHEIAARAAPPGGPAPSLDMVRGVLAAAAETLTARLSRPLAAPPPT